MQQRQVEARLERYGPVLRDQAAVSHVDGPPSAHSAQVHVADAAVSRAQQIPFRATRSADKQCPCVFRMITKAASEVDVSARTELWPRCPLKSQSEIPDVGCVVRLKVRQGS